MFYTEDPQALDTCPYNSSHRILRHRMSTHIVKCRKLHQGENALTVCLFNATHNIPETELQYHLENCPDRFDLDKQVLISKDVDQSKFPIQQVEVENDENWDDENHPTYEPEEYCKKNVVLRQAKVESAATRKNFRYEERSRFQKLKDMGPSDRCDNVSVQAPSQSKFRSTSLSNTTTNVKEESPYTYEDIQRIIQSRAPKPIITDPNYKPTFVRETGQCSKNVAPPNKDEDTENATSLDGTDDGEKENEEKFIKPKSKNRIGKGRGRSLINQ